MTGGAQTVAAGGARRGRGGTMSRRPRGQRFESAEQAMTVARSSRLPQAGSPLRSACHACAEKSAVTFDTDSARRRGHTPRDGVTPMLSWVRYTV